MVQPKVKMCKDIAHKYNKCKHEIKLGIVQCTTKAWFRREGTECEIVYETEWKDDTCPNCKARDEEEKDKNAKKENTGKKTESATADTQTFSGPFSDPFSTRVSGWRGPP